MRFEFRAPAGPLPLPTPARLTRSSLPSFLKAVPSNVRARERQPWGVRRGVLVGLALSGALVVGGMLSSSDGRAAVGLAHLGRVPTESARDAAAPLAKLGAPHRRKGERRSSRRRRGHRAESASSLDDDDEEDPWGVRHVKTRGALGKIRSRKSSRATHHDIDDDAADLVFALVRKENDRQRSERTGSREDDDELDDVKAASQLQLDDMFEAPGINSPFEAAAGESEEEDDAEGEAEADDSRRGTGT